MNACRVKQSEEEASLNRNIISVLTAVRKISETGK